MELAEFAYINSYIGWMDIKNSPFCDFYASHIRQRVLDLKETYLVDKINSLNTFQKLVTSI